MPFCQVIKSNDKWCKNYARKGLTCCWSHRKLENDIPEEAPVEVEEVEVEVEEFEIIEAKEAEDEDYVLEFVEAEEIVKETPWPSLKEARNEIERYSITTLEDIRDYARATSVLELPKQGQRLVALTISEAIQQVPIPKDAKLSVKLLLVTVIRKLTEARYNVEYVLNLLDFLKGL
jgi:predicted DNA-binding protein (UPF0251 family)